MLKLWRWLRALLDFFTLLRVPALIVVLGVVLSWKVDQISELVDITLDPGLFWQRLWVLALALALGVVVWISARSLVCFDLPVLQQMDGTLAQSFGEQFPRLLGAAVPITLAAAYIDADPFAANEGYAQYWMIGTLCLEGVVLWVFTVKRRAMWARMQGLAAGDHAAPTVARLKKFSELGQFRGWHYAGLVALVLSWVMAFFFPHWLRAFGPIACILGAATLAVWASTLPIYWASRKRFPLLTAVFLWACAMTGLDLNDNHAVRLDRTQSSQQLPDAHPLRGATPNLLDYVRQWNATHVGQCPNGPILVSSEGGGIRAAMWTVMVLGELDRHTGGQVSRCVLAMSGVSGGSLGLAASAIAGRDQPLPEQRQEQLEQMMQSDLLSPLLGSMFGLDQLQRVLPMRLFSDRGQALEDAFVRAYDEHVRAEGRSDSPFAASWGELYPEAISADLPVLLLNTTVVDSGERLVQHGFAPIDKFSTWFHAAIDGAKWFPPSLPLAHATHNSARFTFASPAGTVYQMPLEGQPLEPGKLLGQVVDGGYFENSGTETLAEFSTLLVQQGLLQPGQFTAIHISNDPGVEQVGPNDKDCAGDDYKADQPATAPSKQGELLAPVGAILSTRSARGALARQTWAGTVQSKLFHFRLCAGPREVPLGWFIGPGTTIELRGQLLATNGSRTDPQPDPKRPLTNRCQLQQLIGQYGSAASPEPLAAVVCP